jgi:hypothetical protein
MIIRSGTYTDYKGYHLKVYPVRVETSMPNNEKKYILHYEKGEKCPFHDFEKFKHDDGFIKIISDNELTNSYTVQTFGFYRGFKFRVTEFKLDQNIVNIETNEDAAFNKLKLFKVSDQNQKNLYIEQIPILDLETIWEERTASPYNLPIPNNIEPILKIK